MFSKTQILALALSLASAEAASKGFNYGAAKPDGSVKVQADFQSEFQTAKNLDGVSGFNSARLYTMIQGTGSDPISAIPAAIAEGTTLLLGLWSSGDNFDNEIAALKKAIDQYGEEFGKLVVGISVGSEDLYRNSEIGVQANAGVGVEPETLVAHIQRVRETIKGTSLSGVQLGHVDTWNSWTNGSNSAVVDAVDWLGFDGYPYFQNTMANSIDDAKALFDESVAKTKSVANGKEVWMTESGWPVSGDKENLAVASIENAKRFWDEVGCPLFDDVNTWWYILQDASGASTPNPSFGIVGNTLQTKPLFDLTCPSDSKKGSDATKSAFKGTSSGSSSEGNDASKESGSASGSGPDSGSSSSSGSGSSSAAATGFASTTKAASPSASSSSGSGLGHNGSSLGSSGSFSGGHYAGSSSIVVSSSASAIPTPSSSGTSGAGSSGSGSGSDSGSTSGSGAGASGSGSGSGSGTGTSSDQSTTSTSADQPDFTGAGSRLSGSIFGAAILVAALAVAL